MRYSSIPLLIFIATIFLLGCSNKENKIIPSKDAIDLVKTELLMFNKHLPIEGGLGMIITAADYDEATHTIKYRYQYTVPGVQKPNESQIKQAKEQAILVMKNQPKEKKMLEQGFRFSYEYYSIDNEFLFTQDISLDDI